MAKEKKENPRLSYKPILSYDTDWACNPDDKDMPFSGKSVQNFIKQELRGKAGCFDEKDGFVRIFTDEEHRDLYALYESDPTNEEYADYAAYLLTSFRAPAKTYAELGLETESKNVVSVTSTGNYIVLTPCVRDTNSDANTGEGIIVRVEVKHLGNTVATVTRTGNGGEQMSILLDSYLQTDTNGGTYNVKITVQGNESMVTASATIQYTVVALRLNIDGWDFTKAVTGGQLQIPYTLRGSSELTRYIDATIGGQPQQEVTAFNTGTLTYAASGSGKQTVVLQAFVTDTDNNKYTSDALVYDFFVGHGTQKAVLLGYATPHAPADQDYKPVLRQYDPITIKVGAKASGGTVNVTVTDTTQTASAVIMTMAIPAGTVADMTYTPTTVGSHTLTFSADGQTLATLDATVTANTEANINEAEGWALKLSAAGRSNSETVGSRATWKDSANNVNATLTGFQWNARSGWDGDALVIPEGASVTIPLDVLANAASGGATVVLDYEASDVTNDAGNVATAGQALAITAATARFTTRSNVRVETRYRSGDRQHLAFIAYPTTGTDYAAHVIIVNNGIMERAATYSGTVSFNGGNLVIAPTGCTVRLYGVRMYNRALDVDEAFRTYAVDSGKLLEVAQRNDILTNTAIDIDKVSQLLPVMVIECSEADMTALLNVTTKEQRKKTKATVNVTYTNLQDPTKNFTATGATLQCQGTSSLGYPRKNWNIYFGVEGCTMTGSRTRRLSKGYAYSFKKAADNVSGKESAYVPTFCLKADYAESSGSHNTGVARIWNKLMYDAQAATAADKAAIEAAMPANYYSDELNDSTHPLRTRAQNWAAANGYTSDVRTTIDGFPIVLFWKHKGSSVMECMGQYNFNNDKSTEDVFGFTALSTVKDGETVTFDNSHVECWEVLDSEKDIALFHTVNGWDGSSGWAKSFEGRYPKDNTATTAIKALCTALASCYRSDGDYSSVVTGSDWTAAKAKLDLPKVAAYYVYLMRFGAVDQTVKNAMLTTEDGQHWFFINYDNDTVMGIDNSGLLINDWAFQFGGGHYAGETSTLWNCLRADASFITLANIIDGMLITAGMTYDGLCEMFDRQQCAQWPERIYNINGTYKYIGQGTENLAKLQGSRTSYRHWWLGNRMEMFDNLLGNGSWRERNIQLRSWGSSGNGVIAAGTAFTATAAIASTFGWGEQNAGLQAGPEEKAANETISWQTATAYAQGNLLYIYNASSLATLDISNMAEALGLVNVSAAVDSFGKSKLTQLILGDGTAENTHLLGITGLGKLDALQTLDIRGFKAITSLDAVAGGETGLSTLYNLHTLRAQGSGLTSFTPAVGATLTSVALPATIQSIALNGATVASLTMESRENLAEITALNCNSATFAIILTILADSNVQAQLSTVRLAFGQVTSPTVVTDADIATLLTLGSSAIETKQFSGYITKASGTITSQQYNALYAMGIEWAGNIAPDVTLTLSKLTVGVPETGTNTVQATATAIPRSAHVTYSIPETTGVTINADTGLITVTPEAQEETEVVVTASVTHSGQMVTATQTLTVITLEFPTSAYINGPVRINKTGAAGTKEYSLTLSPSSYTANSISSVNYAISGGSGAATLTQSGSGAAKTATMTASTVTATAVNVTLTATITLRDGTSITAQKVIVLQDSDGFVDLGLPSGTLWADGNIVKDAGNIYYIGHPTDGGCYFTWGNVTGINPGDGTEISPEAYAQTAGGGVTGHNNGWSIAPDSGNDAARETLGGTCRMPNKDEASELLQYCSQEYTTRNGVNGYLFTSTINGNTIFMPMVSPYNAPGNGQVWTASVANDEYAYGFFLTPEAITMTGDSQRFSPRAVRPVRTAVPVSQFSISGDAELSTAGSYDYTIADILPADYDQGITSLSASVSTPTTGSIAAAVPAGSPTGVTLTVNTMPDDTETVTLTVTATLTDGSTVTATKQISLKVEAAGGDVVDLDLPSGRLWAKGNIVKNGNAYAVGQPTDYGCYFSWGNVEGHNNGDGYDFGTSISGPYASTPGNSVTTNIASNDAAHDAALATLGSPWRMPTKEELKELYDNTDSQWCTIDGVAGRKFMKKTDHSVYVFLPAAGYGYGSSIGNVGSYGSYWSSSWNSADKAYYMLFDSSSVYPQGSDLRYLGFSVRAVQ